MKRLFSTLFSIILVGNLYSQSRVDSLCTLRPEDFSKIDYVHDLLWSFSKFEQRVIVTPLTGSPAAPKLDGWQRLWFSPRMRSGFSAFIIGIYEADWLAGFSSALNIGTYWESSVRATYQIMDVEACFDNGIPCCQWKYTISDLRQPSESGQSQVTKIETYKDGFLHGLYEVGNDEYKYTTVFRDGTGYYIDLNPDGSTLWEGQLVNGRLDGLWKFYTYVNGKLFRTYIGEYVLNHEISREIQTY